MNSSGMFGALVLLAGVQIILMLSGLESAESGKYSALEAKIASMQRALLERAEAETFLDKALQNSIGKASGKTDPKEIKREMDSEMLRAFDALELNQKGICTKQLDGRYAMTEPLNLQTLDAITKASAVKAGPVTAIEYMITGGPLVNKAPCARITFGGYSLLFLVPPAYTQKKISVEA